MYTDYFEDKFGEEEILMGHFRREIAVLLGTFLTFIENLEALSLERRKLKERHTDFGNWNNYPIPKLYKKYIAN